MTLRNWHKIHKWIWIFTGVFLLAWLISGILMLIPQSLVGADPQVPPIVADYEKAIISPVQAVEIARRGSRIESSVMRINFGTVHDRPVYAVKFENAPETIIDAVSGELFSMSPEFAKTIVLFNFPQAKRPLTVTKLKQHSLAYPFGRLPVYRVSAQENPSTAYFVDSMGGRVFRSTTFTRIRSALISLHDFSTLKLIIDDNRVRKGLLLMAAIAALAGALIGYYMALPHRRRD